MVLFNHTTRELTAKIVYYGPGLSGKTTNLRSLHERLDQSSTGRLLSLATSQDRTIYFDLLPVELGNIKGYAVRFQLCTVPGQVFYNETRKLVLKGVDGIVFVVDSQWSMLSHNLESFQNLRENLREAGLAPESIPTVIQFNKRDLPGVLSVGALQESLGFTELPYVEAVAPEGRGVVETFKLISKLTFIDLVRKLQRPASLEDLRAEGSTTSRGRPSLFRPLTVEAAPPPPPPAAVPPPPPPPPSPDSPFETDAEIPGPGADEIFGIPLRLPEAPAPEELLLPEPPPPVEEPGTPERPRAASNEFEFDLSEEVRSEEIPGLSAAPAAAEPARAEGSETAETPPSPEPEAEPLPAFAGKAVTEPEAPPPAIAPAALDEIALAEAPAQEPSGPPPPPLAGEGEPSGAPHPVPTAADYALLERRVAGLESKLDRILSALLGALDGPGVEAGTPEKVSLPEPREPEV